MEILLQRHNAKCIYVVPEGLKELMSDISREVLRSQPENLYGFIADYLEALLLTRENARVAARLVQSITEIAETTTSFLMNTGMDRTEVDKITTIMNEKFKEELAKVKYARTEQVVGAEEVDVIQRVLSESKIEGEHVEAATLIIQTAYRKFKGRKKAEEKLLSGMIDWRIAARSAIKLYRQTGVTNEEVKRAATLIKAAYKGYYTRRIMKALEEEQKMTLAEPEPISSRLSEDRSSKDSAKDSKIVRLDYDSIIPHVDFKDSEHDIVGNILNDIVINVTSKSPKLSPATPAKKPAKSKPKKPTKPPPMERVPEEPTERISVASMKKRVSIHTGDNDVVTERVSQYSRRSSRRSSQRSKSEVSSTGSAESSAGSRRRSSASYKSDEVSERSHHISERSSFVSADTVRTSVVSTGRSESVESSSAKSSRKSQESSRISEGSVKSQDVSRTSPDASTASEGSGKSEGSIKSVASGESKSGEKPAECADPQRPCPLKGFT